MCHRDCCGRAGSCPVGHIQIGPAIVVVVAYGNSNSPTIVGYACLFRDIGKCAIVVVMKERGVRRGGFSAERVVGHAIDEVDVEPSIVVVIEQCDATAEGLDDLRLGARAAVIAPARQTRLSGIVLEDHGALTTNPPAVMGRCSASCTGA